MYVCITVCGGGGGRLLSILRRVSLAYKEQFPVLNVASEVMPVVATLGGCLSCTHRVSGVEGNVLITVLCNLVHTLLP